jgi:hypothetical protein
MDWLIWLMFFITVIALSGMVFGFLDGRRKHKLALRQEERKLIEAHTKQLEEQNRRMELEFRQAELELERFDRRTTRELGATPQDG